MCFDYNLGCIFRIPSNIPHLQLHQGAQPDKQFLNLDPGRGARLDVRELMLTPIPNLNNKLE